MKLQILALESFEQNPQSKARWNHRAFRRQCHEARPVASRVLPSSIGAVSRRIPPRVLPSPTALYRVTSHRAWNRRRVPTAAR